MRHAVHVCLVSHQPTPNLTPLFDPGLAPDEVVLVTTADMAERAAWLEAVLRPRGVRVSRWSLTDAYDIESLREQLLGLLVERDGEDLALNVTGGTKPMSIAAHEAFRAMGRPVFYVEPTRDRLVWLYHPEGALGARDLEDRIRLEPFLAAHGVSVDGMGPREGIPAARRALCADLVADMGAVGECLSTLNWVAAQAEGTLEGPRPGRAGKAYWSLVDRFAAEGLVRRVGDRLVFPDEAARFFVAGGWFEAYVYGLVYGLRAERPIIQDVGRGVEVCRRGDVRNELDVAFLADNKLHVIECKTRRFDQHAAAGAGAVYKIEALRDVLGGAQGRAMLISFKPLRAADLRRAASFEVEVVAGRDVARLRERLLAWIPTREIPAPSRPGAR